MKKRIGKIILLFYGVSMLIAQEMEHYIFFDNQSTYYTYDSNFSLIKTISLYADPDKKISFYNQYQHKQIVFKLYSIIVGNFGTRNIIEELFINDELVFSRQRQMYKQLTFQKIIANSLFFSFSDSLDLVYSISLDAPYQVTEIQNEIGHIVNIWKYNDDKTFICAIKQNDTISFVLAFLDNNMLSFCENFPRTVLDSNKGLLVHLYSPDTIKIASQKLKEIDIQFKLARNEFIDLAYVINENKIIVGICKEEPDFIANFLFDSSNSIKRRTYRYIIVSLDEKKIKQKKIKISYSRARLQGIY